MRESLSDNQRVYHPVENYDQLKEMEKTVRAEERVNTNESIYRF